MATIRSGSTPVLLVIDAQEGVLAAAHDGDAVLENIRETLGKARERGVPVIWIQHSDQDLVRGSDAWRLAPGLEAAPGERRIDKHHNSSFENTGLEAALAELGATELVLAGAATNWCVRATAYGALDRGYDVTLVSDAHTTETMELEDGTRIEASTLIEDLNIALTWLDYPGRKNRAVRTGDLGF